MEESTCSVLVYLARSVVEYVAKQLSRTNSIFLWVFLLPKTSSISCKAASSSSGGNTSRKKWEHRRKQAAQCEKLTRKVVVAFKICLWKKGAIEEQQEFLLSFSSSLVRCRDSNAGIAVDITTIHTTTSIHPTSLRKILHQKKLERAELSFN